MLLLGPRISFPAAQLGRRIASFDSRGQNHSTVKALLKTGLREMRESTNDCSQLNKSEVVLYEPIT